MKLDDLRRRAATSGSKLLLVGSDVERLSVVAESLLGDGFPSVQVVGTPELNPLRHPRHAAVAALLRSREPDWIRDGIHALDMALDPVRFGLGLLGLGDVDAVVSFGIEPRRLADAARWTLGEATDGAPPGSASWLALPDGRLLACADCVFEPQADAAGRARLA
ncbi:MAG: hypothetical protein ACRENB_10430, partial [Gemmatimonadales bacterium]